MVRRFLNFDNDILRLDVGKLEDNGGRSYVCARKTREEALGILDFESNYIINKLS